MAIDIGSQGCEESPIKHAKTMVEEARALGSSLSSSVNEFTQTIDLRGRVQRHPFGMVLAAAGIGYVLGGGLFSPLTRRLVQIGMRVAVIPLVKSQLGNIVGGQAGEPSVGSAV